MIGIAGRWTGCGGEGGGGSGKEFSCPAGIILYDSNPEEMNGCLLISLKERQREDRTREMEKSLD